MEEPFELLGFPPDVIGEITSYLPALDILHLFMCGNKQLMYALGPAGGLKRLNIHVTPWRDMPWLSVISLFVQLRYFSINIISYRSFILLNMDLRMVSRELRTLELNFLNVANLLLEPQEALSAAVPNSEVSKLRYFDLNAQFPLLEHLTLVGSTRFSANLIDVLPINLRSFVLRGMYYKDFSPAIINKLPRSLTLLELTAPLSSDIQYEDFPSESIAFPPYLDTLILAISWPESVYERIPHSVTHLELNARLLSEKVARILPPNLLTLHSPSIGFRAEFAALLPRSLTNLQITGVGKPPPAEWPALLAALPRGLVHYPVVLSYVPSSSFAAIPPLIATIEDAGPSRTPEELLMLPRLLISFTCKQPLDNAQIAALPHTLKTLRMNMAKETTVDLESWPPHLSTLHISMLAPETCVTAKLNGGLPVSLTDLEIPWTIIAENDHGRLLSRLTSLKGLTLSSSLLSLSRSAAWMVRSGFDPQEAAQLAAWRSEAPTTHEFVTAFSHFIKSLAPASQVLPTSLTRLSTYQFLPEHWATDLGHLDKLTHLDFSAPNTRNYHIIPPIEINSTMLSSLPDSLLWLNLFAVSDFDVAALKALPPHLYNFQLTSFSTIKSTIQNEDLRFLPRYLFALSIPESSRINDGFKEYAPSTLCSFCNGPNQLIEVSEQRNRDLDKAIHQQPD